ncbi:PREDICTED: uncharacterized protein LOC104748877 [Camelina sativa]|uniref:Uncharacterized protein LOC104748877 n=1 Tax=Camelina sativa TaxID=90675 RepID=A0ABM0WBQ2_CAMSA|nr:PREDICTED: uncharacterized protein LOC104748877 [Camelina sativa]
MHSSERGNEDDGEVVVPGIKEEEELTKEDSKSEEPTARRDKVVEVIDLVSSDDEGVPTLVVETRDKQDPKLRDRKQEADVSTEFMEDARLRPSASRIVREQGEPSQIASNQGDQDQVVPDPVESNQIVLRRNSPIRAVPLQMVLPGEEEEPMDRDLEKLARMYELRRQNREHIRFEIGESSSNLKKPRMSYQEFQAMERPETRPVTSQPRGRLRMRATARKKMVYPNQVHMRNTPYCELCEGVGHWTKNCWRTALRRMCDPTNQDCEWCGMRGHFAYRCPNPDRMRYWRQCEACGEPGHPNNHCWRTRPQHFVDPEQVMCTVCGELGHLGDHCWRARPERMIFQEPSRCTECGESGHFSPNCPYQIVRENLNPINQREEMGENPIG